MQEEDSARRAIPIAHEIGQDLAKLSVAELSERIALLESEIERLKAAREAKDASKRAADLFFRQSS